MPVAAAPALSLVFCLSAAILLTFVSVSAPTWNKIYFLNAGATHFGVFGSTGTHISVGYRFPTDRALNTSVTLNLTRALLLHPIGDAVSLEGDGKTHAVNDKAAGMAGFAFFSGASCHRAGTVVMVLLAALATVVCLLVFILDLALFGIARNNFRAQGIPSQYGNACWLTLAGLVAILLGFSTAACTVFARYKKRNNPGI